MIADYDKMDRIIVKEARNNNNPSDEFLISLYFAENVATIRSGFGEQFDKQTTYHGDRGCNG
jgi:hypothetical protein